MIPLLIIIGLIAVLVFGCWLLFGNGTKEIKSGFSSLAQIFKKDNIEDHNSIVASAKIVNLHSHPLQGEDWIISFETEGRADLKIIPQDQATIDDDEFVGLYCGEEQRKPQISLQDCVQSNVNAVKLEKTGEFRVYNQTTETISIVQIAQSIVQAAKGLGLDARLEHIPNPRVEKEEHKMVMDTTHFRGLLPDPVDRVASGVHEILKSLIPFKERIHRHMDRFLVQ